MPTSTQSIREIIAKQPSAIQIFHRFDIDLCLQGDLSLEGACKELQLSVDQVLEKLSDAEAQEGGGAALDPETLIARASGSTHRARSSSSRSPGSSRTRRNGPQSCSETRRFRTRTGKSSRVD